VPAGVKPDHGASKTAAHAATEATAVITAGAPAGNPTGAPSADPNVAAPSPDLDDPDDTAESVPPETAVPRSRGAHARADETDETAETPVPAESDQRNRRTKTTRTPSPVSNCAPARSTRAWSG